MRFTTFKVGHKKPHIKQKRDETPNASCATGGFYTAPTNGASIPALDPLELTWDPTCLDTSTADIYLFAPGSSRSRIHVWEGVPFGAGKYTIDLMPRWWNSTASQALQIAIVESGQPPFLTPLPAGPVFTATYTAPTDGSAPPTSADTSQVDSGITQAAALGPGTTKSMSPGKTAAAVLLPLLFVILLIAAYLKFQRSKVQKSRKRFSQAVDKRMSTISTDWKSMSAAGAQAAIRNSMAVGRDSAAFNRDSSAFAFGQIRPMSGLAVGAAAGSYNTEKGDGGEHTMTQVRTGTGVGLRGAKPTGERVSRVSFAADPRVSRVSFADTVGRPSGESRRTRAFHSAYIPPVPTRSDVISAASVYPETEVSHGHGEKDEMDTPAATLSPRQTQGPLTLTPEDIRARINGKNQHQAHQDPAAHDSEQEQMDEVLPALSMMRTGNSTSTTAGDEYLFTPMPTPPTPIHAKPTSPYSGASAAGMYGSGSGAGSSSPVYGLSPFIQGHSPSTAGATYGSPVSGSGSGMGMGSGMSLASPMTPSSPSVFGQQQQQQLQEGSAPQPQVAMSPDEMLRAYAERKAALAAAGGAGGMGMSTSTPPVSTTPKKSRKLSIRASFGGRKADRERERERERLVIGYPMPVATPVSPVGAVPTATTAGDRASTMTGAGMAGVGVGVGAGVGAGLGLVGATYAIGEDEGEEDNESAYIGTAN